MVDCRNRADSHAEVVTSEPVGEVVLRTQIAPARVLRAAAEVRRLVPAVARAPQPLDDELEVRLHRLGLPSELGPVGVGEARPRLGLELVAGEVLRSECERFTEVRLEVGGALAGNAVEQVERDVVKSDITKMVES